MKKRIKWIICSATFLSIVVSSMPVMAVQQESSIVYDESNSVQPRTDIKQWRYKVENGNLYKRLYNYTRNRWETDWIFVMSGVEEL